MRVLVIGGTGRCGRLVIDELLGRGHQVTTLARTPDALGGPRPGTPMNLDDVRAAFKADKPDVVIVTLNAPRASDSPFAAAISPPRLMADCNANVVAAMKEFGVRKTVILQAFGVGASWANLHILLRLLMKTSNMSHQYDDHNETEREVLASGVGYVFVRPSRLVETEETAIKVWPDDGKGVPMMASTSRISVARYLVDVAESDEWDNTAPVITN
ncbi:TrkA-N domain dehydrogenase [Aspergillus eucalypticola CBS 122712]|uniref:TrkA-N domain dehydrogenase n=1 Tax=Aspergillus eucalypticola (strain CBS 122712 / IBT 29274) TaxID=1448314 RepID=A0A317VP80_ASPEC|nr:TrkA-N domain dehydrogenase [Aspergillus eucalypticola CBS 122712]PWY74877.1 TrkA-N domain dehydrogenase [Aspergillus eucalypticola CBS 122712]